MRAFSNCAILCSCSIDLKPTPGQPASQERLPEKTEGGLGGAPGRLKVPGKVGPKKIIPKIVDYLVESIIFTLCSSASRAEDETNE